MNYKIKIKKNKNKKKKKTITEDVDWDDLLELAQVERGMSKTMGPDGQTHR